MMPDHAPPAIIMPRTNLLSQLLLHLTPSLLALVMDLLLRSSPPPPDRSPSDIETGSPLPVKGVDDHPPKQIAIPSISDFGGRGKSVQTALEDKTRTQSPSELSHRDRPVLCGNGCEQALSNFKHVLRRQVPQAPSGLIDNLGKVCMRLAPWNYSQRSCPCLFEGITRPADFTIKSSYDQSMMPTSGFYAKGHEMARSDNVEGWIIIQLTPWALRSRKNDLLHPTCHSPHPYPRSGS